MRYKITETQKQFRKELFKSVKAGKGTSPAFNVLSTAALEEAAIRKREKMMGIVLSRIEREATANVGDYAIIRKHFDSGRTLLLHRKGKAWTSMKMYAKRFQTRDEAEAELNQTKKLKTYIYGVLNIGR